MADPFAAFEGRYGAQSGGGGDVWSGFENRFSIAKMNPKNSQIAGGLNNLTEQQLAKFGYKPSDIADWNDLPARKQKKLEDVLTSIGGYDKKPVTGGNVIQQDLGTWGGLRSAAKSAVPGLTETAIKGTTDFFGFGGHSVGEYTPQYLKEHPEIDPKNLVKVPSSKGFGDVYVDRFNTPYTWREPVQAGINVGLMKGMPAVKFLGAGNNMVTRAIGSGLRTGLENTGQGFVNDMVFNDKGSMDNRTQQAPGNDMGARFDNAISNAPSNFVGGALLGSVMGNKKVLTKDDNVLNLISSEKELKDLVKTWNFGTSTKSLQEVLGAISDANVSTVAKREAKKQITDKVSKLDDQLALPSPSGIRTGDGFTMTDTAPKATTAIAKKINSIDKKLSDMESGKISTTANDYNVLKQQREDLVSRVQSGNIVDEPVRPTRQSTRVTTDTPVQGGAGNVTSQNVVGTGKTRQSELGRSTQQKAVDKKLTETIGDVPEYRQVNMADQAKASTDLLSVDEVKATRIALGKEEPPVGLLPESVYIAVENKALKEGNVQLLNDLAHSSRVTEATTMGQRIRTLGERDPDSAVAAIREIVDARKPKSKIEVAKVTSEAKAIQETVKKTTRQDWNSFVESIRC